MRKYVLPSTVQRPSTKGTQGRFARPVVSDVVFGSLCVTSATTYPTTRRTVPEELDLRQCHSEKLLSCMLQ